MTPSQIAPVACTLPKEELARRTDALFATIRRDAIAVAEVANGFVITFARTRIRQHELEAMIAAERRCCPFLDFHLEVVDQAVITVAITGTPDGKAYLASTGLAKTLPSEPTSAARLAALGGVAWLAAAATFACCLLPAAVVGVGAAYFDGAGLALGLTGFGLFAFAIHRRDKAAHCGC